MAKAKFILIYEFICGGGERRGGEKRGEEGRRGEMRGDEGRRGEKRGEGGVTV